MKGMRPATSAMMAALAMMSQPSFNNVRELHAGKSWLPNLPADKHSRAHTNRMGGLAHAKNQKARRRRLRRARSGINSRRL